jgi:excisionase family DNA binding protein
MDHVLTTSDAARILNRSADRVRDLERSGRLPAIKTRSGQRLFSVKDVERLAQELESNK